MNAAKPDSNGKSEILVVEDDELNLKTLSATITAAGYQARSARDGDSALDSIREKRPDLVLMDISIPGLNGIDVCKFLKQDPLTFDIPVIFISGSEDTETIVVALEAGGADYVTKPYHPFEILARIKTHLDMAKKVMELRVARDALSESQDQYRQLTATMPDAVIVSQDEMLLYANSAAAQLLGALEPEALVGLNIFSVIDSTQHEFARKQIQRVMAGEKLSPFENRLIRFDGTLVLTELSVSMTTWNSRVALQAVVRDITKRKYLENELVKSEALMRTALENLPIIFYMIDSDGKFTLSIGAGLKGLGLKSNQVVGQSAFEIYKDYPEITNALHKSLGGEIATFESQVAGSSYINVCVPFGAAPGANTGIVAVALDITERKRAEESLQKMQKLESLGILAGGIAHDFNNLMGGIFGYIDLAIDECKDSAVSKYLMKTMSTIERARALTLQLLTFAKGGDPIKNVIPLFPFVRETAQFALSGSNVSCRFEVPDGLWPCAIDKNQIGQVVDNIVINAQQAMPGGGPILVSAGNVSFKCKEHSVLAEGDYVRISIQDCGIGIPPNILPHIFDPFYTTKSKGHGLGLSTCFSIVSRHNGAIDVESEPGKGSTFHVYLPASQDAASSETESAKPIHTGKGTFVVMDDEGVMLDIIGDMLESLGYTTVRKINGTQVCDFVHAEIRAHKHIAGMIFDLTVPGDKGGKEIIGEIRKICPTTPVFVASGYAKDTVMGNPADYGFTASICKPFRKAELVEMLNKHRGA
jgi:PAS domain S-box-containing protein